MSNNCPHCNEVKSYSGLYDAYYCSNCDIWLEKQCDDPYCEYCSNRPEKPSET